MSATVVLCVLSTLSFCFCARGFLWLAPMLRRPTRARRLALNYVMFSLFVLMAFSLVSAVSSYIELFQINP